MNLEFQISNIVLFFQSLKNVLGFCIFLRLFYEHPFSLQTCHKESVCHLIFVKPVQDVAEKADDSIIVVDRNKENILEALTSCLEQPLCTLLQEWLHLYSEDPVILGEVEALYKTRLNHNNAIDPPKVPDDLKIYLSKYTFFTVKKLFTPHVLISLRRWSLYFSWIWFYLSNHHR